VTELLADMTRFSLLSEKIQLNERLRMNYITAWMKIEKRLNEFMSDVMVGITLGDVFNVLVQ
jgi:hypothetical protein